MLIVLGFMYQVLPGGRLEVQADNDKAVYTWGPITATDTNTKAVGNGWSRYNFMGYEGRGAYYTEYYDVVQTMKRIGEDPSLGLRSGIVGEQRRQRQLRHDDGADAAAVLDRRLHRLDGGSVLRGVGHDAVPLPHDGGDVEAVVEPGARRCATTTTTPPSACATCRTSASST